MARVAAVAGASGYAGGELLRLLSSHPEVELGAIAAHSNAGMPVDEVHPALRSLAGRRFNSSEAERLAESDVVFFALPHGLSADLAADVAARNPGALLIDCGADHRLESETSWEQFYGGPFNEPWVYGVPELPHGLGRQRELLKDALRIAAPGCNASTVALSLAPGLKAGVIRPQDMVSTLAVGPSGAGRTARTDLLAAELLGNARVYSVAGTHRHLPEIRQSLEWATNSPVAALAFTPVLVPMARGILAVSSAPIEPGVDAASLHDAWQSWYQDEPFVQVLPTGKMPQVSDVIGANTALIGIAYDEQAGRALMVAAIDNLAKGTAGAAVQSMNIALGLEETLGLTIDGIAP